MCYLQNQLFNFQFQGYSTGLCQCDERSTDTAKKWIKTKMSFPNKDSQLCLAYM